MLKRLVFLFALVLSVPASAETASGMIDGHSFRLAGQNHQFTLIVDGRLILHDTRHQKLSIAGLYGFGATSTEITTTGADGTSSSSSSSSYSGDSGPAYGIILIAEASGAQGCALQYQALILGPATKLSPPFGSCAGPAKITRMDDTLVVETPEPSGAGDEVDTITATGVTPQRNGG